MRPVPVSVQATIEKAELLLSRGQAKEAAQTIQPVTLAHPAHARAHLVAARAFRDLGKTDLALARYKSAAEATKNFALWREYVTELLRAGQKGRARKAASKAPVRGAEKKALLELAKTGLQTGAAATGGVSEDTLARISSLMRAGQMSKAAEAAREQLATHPESAFLHNILGIVALSENDAEAAEPHFLKTLELSPVFSGARGNLGLALIAQRKFDEAVEVLSKAVIDDPRSLAVRTNLASAHLKAMSFEAAREQAEKALEIAPDDPDALFILASALNKLRDHETARTHLARLLKLRPADPEALSQMMIALESGGLTEEALSFAVANAGPSNDLARRRGDLLAQLGHLDEAETQLRSVIETTPDDANAYLSYGGLRKWDPEDPVLEKLQAFWKHAEHTKSKSLAGFALAKARMDLGEDKAAMETLHAANSDQAISSKRVYDPDAMDREIQRLKERWNADVFSRLDGIGAETVRPIFVIGMARSGSTLLDQILCAHPALTGTGEDSVVAPFFPVDIEASEEKIKAASREGALSLRKVAGADRQVVDKFLYNFLRVGALAVAFPRARFLDTSRDPRSIAVSIYSNAMKVDGHPYSTDLAQIGRFFLSYETLMKHWQAVLGSRIRTVSYETLVADPEPEIRAVLDWLELRWDGACLKPNAVARRVKTLSLTQVRGEISTASVEKWRRFETELAPFIEVLERAGRL